MCVLVCDYIGGVCMISSSETEKKKQQKQKQETFK